jgi:ABC-2 type transport system ATP-binding protein
MPHGLDPAIDVVDLSRRFGSRVAVEALSFAVGPGEILALLGPNGAGKTTTLRVLAGLLSPTTGRVTVGGVVRGPGSAGPIPGGGVGLLTETPGLWDRLSVETNLLTYARLYGVSDARSAVRRVLDRLGLADRGRDLAAVLSKGLRQRVALARALLHRPPVLLLDEPTSGLDPASAKDVRDIVTGLRLDGVATLLCTHNLTEAEQLADRIGIVKTRLLAMGTAAELRGSHGEAATIVVDVEGEAAPWRPVVDGVLSELVMVGSRIVGRLTPAAAVPDIVAALVQAGARVRSVHAEAPTLEQVYLSLVGSR